MAQITKKQFTALGSFVNPIQGTREGNFIQDVKSKINSKKQIEKGKNY